MLQKTSSVFIVYRRKTLAGSPDPTHANGTDKPYRLVDLNGAFKNTFGHVSSPLEVEFLG